MEIVKLTAADTKAFIELIQIFNEVFEKEPVIPPVQYLEALLRKPDFFVLVAKDGEEVTGGLTVYVLHTCYSEKPVAYIYDVGVKPDLQRKGTGRALLNYLRQYCRENGFLEAYVEAETDDTDAVNFYKRTNWPHELQATHFTYTFEQEVVPNEGGEPAS